MASGPCPTCGQQYERLGQHWAMSSDCDYPPVPPQTHEICTGILMGDGTIHKPKSAANTQFQAVSINKRFLTWLDDLLGPLSNGVTLRRTTDEIYAQNKKSSYSRFSSLDYEARDQYVLTTVRHPEFNWFDSWYIESGKCYPPDLELTRDVLKYWYVCDGHLIWGAKGHIRPQVWISVQNEADRPDYIRSLFGDTPISPNFNEGRLMLTSDETEWFFEYVGAPPAGFEYKFATESKQQYRRMKEAFYEQNTTQNAVTENGS